MLGTPLENIVKTNIPDVILPLKITHIFKENAINFKKYRFYIEELELELYHMC